MGRHRPRRSVSGVEAAPTVAATAPFVGREVPLHDLAAAVEAAGSGRRMVALVAGEPGVGKTRLVSEGLTHVPATALWATCSDGEVVPPYWHWVQLVRGAIALVGADGVERLGERERTELTRLVEQLPSADVSADARFRLFDAVVELFSQATRHKPLVIVLDDLQWADEASIALLRFVVGDGRLGRLAVVGTYRDSEVDSSHPLARCLDELLRDGRHIALTGLTRREVTELVGSLSGGDAELADVASLLHRRSGGNPLFVRELVRLLHANRDLGGGRAGLAAVVPTGVRAVVGRRLGGLSTSARGALSAASVIGTEFELAVLAAVTGQTGAQVLRNLDEAVDARLIEPIERRGSFGFVHALVREVLYDELGGVERAGLHHRVATVIADRYGDARVSELAHHVLLGSLDKSDSRAVDLSVQAGEHSLGLLAYEEAAGWFRRALDVLHADHPSDPREADLLVRCGEALSAAGDLPASRETHLEAAAVARRHGDPEQLARAALGLGAGLGGFEVRLRDLVQVDLLEEAARKLDPAPSSLRAWVLARLSVALSFMHAEDRRRSLSEEAIAVAREVGDPAALGYALAGHCDVIAGPDDCEKRLAESAEVTRLAQQIGNRELELLGRRLRIVALLEVGDIGAVDAQLERYGQVADRLRQPLYQWYVPLWRGMRALMRRELDEAARWCAEAKALGAMAHSDNAYALTITQSWVRQRYEDRVVEAGRAMAELLESVPDLVPETATVRVVAATQLGDHDKARVLLEQWMSAGMHQRPRDSEWLPETAQLAEVAVIVDAREVAEMLFAQLEPYHRLFCAEGIGAAFMGSVSWYLAIVARYLGRTADAEAHEAHARTAHRSVGLVGDPPALADSARIETSATAPEGPAGAALLAEGATWAVTYGGKTRRLRDGKGVRDLAVLLARPDEEVHCLELVGGVDVGSEAGPALDDQARRVYQQRIRDLQEDIDDARDANDPARAERAEAELDILVQQLSEAFGLSGRARATGSSTERARSTVSQRVRAALRHVDDVHPELGRHLHNSVRTGVWCSYRPESAVAWQIARAEPPTA